MASGVDNDKWSAVFNSVKMKRSVVIIGTGGVAESLAWAVTQSAELDLVQVWGRNQTRVAEIAYDVDTGEGGESLWDLDLADIYILAVSDRAIASISRLLEFPRESIVVHTAGSISMDEIAHPQRGVIYPFQSFSAGHVVPFERVPLFVEGSDEATTREITEVARELSPSVQLLGGEARRRLHLCGVFASNFVNSMLGVAADIAQSNGIEPSLMRPLVEQTIAKAFEADDPRQVQTGPAVRGDKATQERHCELLEGDDRVKEIYNLMSQYIWETSKKM